MTPALPPPPADDRLGDALASAHEAMGGGNAGPADPPPDLPPDLRARFTRSVSTLRLLQRTFGPAHPPVRPVPPPPAARYALRQLHAMGGVGEVWLATDTFLGREVALKELRPERSGHGGLHDRLLQEARVTSRLQHPGVVPVYELADDPADGDPFFTMRFVRGRTLAEAVRAMHARPRADRPVEMIRLMNAFVSICQTVAYAHAKGVVHRDLKTENVILGDYGEVVVIDWGFAAVRGEPEQPAAAVGTPAYMAPEQAAGGPAAEAADVYGLGAILYEVLTGRPPYLGDGVADTLAQVKSGPPPRPEGVAAGVPPGLAAVCRKAMARVPADRYPTADALARDVQRWLADLPPAAHREPLASRLARFGRRHRTGVAAAVTLAFAAAAGALAVGATQTRAAARMAAADAAARVEFAHEQEQTRQQSARAEQERANAVREKDQAERQRYLHLIARAERDLRANNLSRCGVLLDQCPPAYRGWEWDCLQRLRRSEPVLLRGHTDGVRTLAFRPGTTDLATAGYEPTVRVWDVSSASHRMTLTGFTRAVGCVAYSADGTRLAAGSWDGRVAVWDGSTGKNLFTVQHPNQVERVRFSPDGRRLASISRDHVRVWDADGRPVSVPPLPAGTGPVRAVLFRPDSRLFGAAGPLGITLVDLDLARSVGPLPDLRRYFRAEAVSPDGTCLASSTADLWYGGGSEIVLSDLATGRTLRKLVGHSDPAFGLAFSPDGRRLASAGTDHTVRVWDPLTGEETLTLWGHEDAVRAVGFSSDGRYLAGGGDDKVVRVWDSAALPTEAPRYELYVLRDHGRRVVGVVPLPDEANAGFASVGEDNVVRFWDDHRGTEVRNIRLPFAWGTSLACTPDGRRLAVPSSNALHLIDAATGKIDEMPHGHDFGQVMSVAFGPDGRRMATGGWDRTAKVWDAGTKRATATLKGHTQRVAGVAFDPVRDRVATAGGDGVVKVWDAKSGRDLATLDGPGGGCRAVAFSPNGRWLAGSGGDGAVAVWDAASFELRDTLRGHAGAVDGLAFRPDSTALATASSDWTVKLWRIDAAGRAAADRTFRGHDDRVRAVAFVAGGRRVVSAGDDGTVRVWDATDPSADVGVR